jgi:hypothetical protein
MHAGETSRVIGACPDSSSRTMAYGCTGIQTRRRNVITPITATAVMISPHETPTRALGIGLVLPLRRTSMLKSPRAQCSFGAAC